MLRNLIFLDARGSLRQSFLGQGAVFGRNIETGVMAPQLPGRHAGSA